VLLDASVGASLLVVVVVVGSRGHGGRSPKT
jgi:hypothetical protein